MRDITIYAVESHGDIGEGTCFWDDLAVAAMQLDSLKFSFGPRCGFIWSFKTSRLAWELMQAELYDLKMIFEDLDSHPVHIADRGTERVWQDYADSSNGDSRYNYYMNKLEIKES